MNRDRLWILGALAAMAIIAFGGWSLGISPALQATSQAADEAAALADSNDTNTIRLMAIKKQFDQLDEIEAKRAQLRVSIPEGADASVFIREISALCKKNKVSLASVSINDARVYTAPAPTEAPAAPPVAGASTSTPTPTPTAAATTAAPAVAPSVPGVAAGGFVLVPVSIEVTGKLTAVSRFIGAVQTGDRLYLASTVSTAEVEPGSPEVRGTIDGLTFALQGAEATAAATAAAAASADPSATPAPESTANAAP